MPYLRMFLGEQQLDETFISEVFVQSILGNHIVEEEKQKMLDKHMITIRKTGIAPSFTLDSIPSTINQFAPLDIKKTNG